MKNATDITIVLDRSGSMQDLKEATIENVNRFVAEQKAIPGECSLSLIQFASRYVGYTDQDWYQRWWDALPITSVPKLTNNSYTPNGGTALYDAMGKAIDDTGARLRNLSEEDRPAKVVFVVITDGEENSSTTYTREKVFEMITHQESKYGWSFSFLGAGIDAFKTGGSIGMRSYATANVAYNQFAYQNVYTTLSNKLASTRSAGMAVAASDTMAFNANDLSALSATSESELLSPDSPLP